MRAPLWNLMRRRAAAALYRVARRQLTDRRLVAEKRLREQMRAYLAMPDQVIPWRKEFDAEYCVKLVRCRRRWPDAQWVRS
jgi:hypothetical protein